tara:strand:+ start:653 stop:1171 length:519 start_codon:yes stop_codon:yes gene_type:complete
VQEKLNIYFAPDNWQANNDFHYTGEEYLKSVIPHGNTILDVGCGYNLFKDHYGDLLYGIDPANPAADEMVTIEALEVVKKYDIALCLGSLNFGDEFTILSQINKVVQCIKTGGTIYWRQNPGQRDRPFKGNEDIDFFPWSFLNNCTLSDQVGCKVIELKWDNDRIYAVWEKR